MKMASLVLTLLGGLGLVLSVAGKIVSSTSGIVFGVSPRGYVEGASALFLFALALMAHDRWYGCAKTPPSAP